MHTDATLTNQAKLVYCSSGVSLGGDGSTRALVSTSCNAVFLLFNVTNANTYIDANLNGNSAVLVRCLNGTSLGGDGASRSNVAASCLSAYSGFAVSNSKIYVHASLDAANAVLVQCVNRTSYGGDGSSMQASSTSCGALSQYWGRVNGVFHVNGAQSYVFFISCPSH